MSYNNELYPYTQNETPEPGAPAPEPQRKQKRGKAGKTVALVLCSALLCGAMGFGGGMLASSLSDTQTSSSAAIVGWCPFNETWGGQDPRLLQMMYAITKAMDTTPAF